MSDSGNGNGRSHDYDAVIVGASLAGATTAILLGRAGASVALVEKQPDPQAFKRICSHFIQASAVPTIERLGLLEPIMEAGGVRSRMHAWTRWGWIEAPPDRAGLAVNLRREVLDPMVREAAAATPGVDLLLGRAANGLLRDGDAVAGVNVRAPSGEESESAGEAGRRRRRPRLQDRRALRRKGKGPPPRALCLRRLFRGRAAQVRARRLDLDAGPALGRGVPDRQRPRLLRGDADDGAAARVQARSDSGADLLHRSPPRSAADPLRPAGGPGPRQDRDAEPGARPDRAGAGPDRRRGAGHRPALRRRLRLGVSVRRMARRQRRAGAARRGVPGSRLKALSPAPQTPAGRPRLHDSRLRHRPQAQPRRTGAVRRRRPRPEGRGEIRQVRDAPGRAGPHARDHDPALADGQRAALAQAAPRGRARRAARAGRGPRSDEPGDAAAHPARGRRDPDAACAGRSARGGRGGRLCAWQPRLRR